MINRVIWIILDSLGMGEMPDANKYGDVGSNTIGNVSKKAGGLKLPNLTKLGLGNIDSMVGIEKSNEPIGVFARMTEKSNGKDTITGHWEMGGILIEKAFPVYPDGFPIQLIEEFEKRIQLKTLGNVVASGTVIIEELGEEHVHTGYPIVYTSADSVFQIAAHEEVVPLEKLYKICEIARELLDGEYKLARVIARPFIGKKGSFTRTPNRKDYPVDLPHETILDKVMKKGNEVVAIGKIGDIFNYQGITKSIKSKDNHDGIEKTLESMRTLDKGIIFTNLNDFDSKWGHRNNYVDYGKGLEEFDIWLGELLFNLKENDAIIMTADHGCDPTFPGTDHTREYVPFLGYSKQFKMNINLGTRTSFADIGQTLANLFQTDSIKNGSSFYDLIKK